jgi:hypothetical protein
LDIGGRGGVGSGHVPHFLLELPAPDNGILMSKRAMLTAPFYRLFFVYAIPKTCSYHPHYFERRCAAWPALAGRSTTFCPGGKHCLSSGKPAVFHAIAAETKGAPVTCR